MNRGTLRTVVAAGVAAAAVAVAVATVDHVDRSRVTATTPAQAVATERHARLAASPMDPQTQPETHFVAITPCRIIDTRAGGGPLHNLTPRSFYVGGTTGFETQGGQSGGCAVPTNAISVAATVAVVNPNSSGYLKAFPTGAAVPTSAVLNFAHSNSAVSTGATQTLAPTQPKPLSLSILGAPVNAVVDVSGYYIPQIQALIASDGTVSAGTPRILSTSHPGTGSFYITLDRPARQCSPSANTYNLYRYASVGLSSSTTPNTISVYLWTLNASHVETPADYPFFLTVSC